MNILIADDDSVSRRLLQNYLQKWGYQVTAAQDGAEAWRLFEGGILPMVITYIVAWCVVPQGQTVPQFS